MEAHTVPDRKGEPRTDSESAWQPISREMPFLGSSGGGKSPVWNQPRKGQDCQRVGEGILVNPRPAYRIPPENWPLRTRVASVRFLTRMSSEKGKLAASGQRG